MLQIFPQLLFSIIKKCFNELNLKVLKRIKNNVIDLYLAFNLNTFS